MTTRYRVAALCGLLGICGLSHGSASLRAEAQAQLPMVDAAAVKKYVLACQKPNGAFGPIDQEYTDAAWNYPAVATLVLLGEVVPNADAVLKHGSGHPQGHDRTPHWQFYFQYRLHSLLGAPIVAQQEPIELIHQGYEVSYYNSPFGTDGDTLFKADGRTPFERGPDATKLRFYNLSSLYYLLGGLNAYNQKTLYTKPLGELILRCQTPSGGFADVRTKDGVPVDSDAHVAHTFQAVAALRWLKAEIPNAERCAAFIQACQLPSGGFRWNPADLPGNAADIYYTRTALEALDLLGSKPKDKAACLAWINSLQNADGGFGDQPSWRSRLYSTYCAVASLKILEGDLTRAITAKQLRPPVVKPISDAGLAVYQSLFKMPTCTPADLQGLRERGFNLIALKSGKFEDAAQLLPAITEQKLPMDAILCLESYPHRLKHFGGVTLNHVGNFTLDPRWNEQQRAVWQAADMAGAKSLPWDEYAKQVIEPLRRQGVLCYPEQDFDMEVAYRSYDQGLAGLDGYNAVLAGFNWPPRDFVRVFPWRERWVDKMTPITDCDAHGDLAKWSPQLDCVRHLFIARGPTYAHFQEAVQAGRVVCVIAQPEGVASGASYYGRPEAVDYVRDRISQWRWWKE